MADNNSIRVDIYDQAYNLRGLDEERIRKLAEVVDAKMRAVAEHSGAVDSLRVAVLAALNLADELMTVRARNEALVAEYASKTERLHHALDSAMNPQLARRRRAG